MAQADSAPPSDPDTPAPPEPPPRKLAPAGIAVAAMALLLVFVASQGRVLWAEWTELRRDMARVQRTAVIGYQNIHPRPSFALKPPDWIHDEGEFTLLWSQWDGEGHRWFRVGRGEVDRQRISYPLGRDVIQAIDYPITEHGGGTIWSRIPNDAQVAGFTLAGTLSVYPIQVLDKVVVVNDVIADRPFLVTFNPLGDRDGPVHIYEPIVEGRRVTMGLSGYFQDKKPLLYDRGSESLWVEAEQGDLVAIAGRYKGSRMSAIEQHRPVAWADWRQQNPSSRLLVGADRSRTTPAF